MSEQSIPRGRQIDLQANKKINTALVLKQGVPAATITRENNNNIAFSYLPEYLKEDLPPVATSLPKTDREVITNNGGLPAFFSGLLPEGYRLNQLIQAIKTSPDDELSLLLAVGNDTPGDVQIIHPEQEKSTYRSGTIYAKDDREVSFNTDPVSSHFQSLDYTAISFNDFLTTIDTVSIPGVQPKASSQMLTFPLNTNQHPYIIKLSPQNYPGLIENEQLHLQAAKKLGMPVSESKIITDKDDNKALLVSRFDRVGPGGKQRIALEDAGQIMQIVPAAKYLVSTEEVITTLAQVSKSYVATALGAYTQFLFAWLTGNGDLHAKNMSLLGTQNEWKLSPIYDVTCTLIYGDNTMALTVSGRDRDLRRRHWEELADSVKLPQKAAEAAMKKALTAAEKIDLSYLPITGSPLRATQKELRNRRYELEYVSPR